MKYACNRKEPNPKYYHDPKIKDDFGKTVEDYLKQNKIMVSESW